MMDSMLDFISKGKSKLQLAQDAVANDDVIKLQKILQDSNINEDYSFPNSPKENLLTHAINRNADKCCLYLITKLKWSCMINLDTIYCPLFLCFIQCYFPVCYEVFKTVNNDMKSIIEKAPKYCSLFDLLQLLIWPIDNISNKVQEKNELRNEIEISNKTKFEDMNSLFVLSRAKVRAIIRDWMIEIHAKGRPVPNYFYLINQLNLPQRMIYYMAYSDLWPSWNRNETKSYRGRPRLPDIDFIIMD